MFTWTPIYKELAKAMLPFKTCQKELIHILANIKKCNVPITRPIAPHIAAGEGYRETTHQVALTQMRDFAHLQRPEIDPLVPAFGALSRACQFLAQQIVQTVPGAVYPPPQH